MPPDFSVAKLSPITTEYTDNLRNLAEYFTKLSEQANLENDAIFERAKKISFGSIIVEFLYCC